MSEWDDRINELLVEIDALDNPAENSALEVLWLKVLSLAAGVDDPPAEVLGELVNDVLDCFPEEVVDLISGQLADIFDRIEKLFQQADSESACGIWCDILYTMLGETPRIEDFRQLVQSILTPPDEFVGDAEDEDLHDDSTASEVIDLPPVDNDSDSSNELSQDDLEIIREAEVAMKDTSPATSIPVNESIQWQLYINKQTDEEIISILNRLFAVYGIDAKLSTPEELKNHDVFTDIRNKFNLPETIELIEYKYKSSWSIIYNKYLKSKGATFAKKPTKKEIKEEVKEEIKEEPSKETINNTTQIQFQFNWPQKIDGLNDEELLLFYNQLLFPYFGIEAKIETSDELKKNDKFNEIKSILGVTNILFKNNQSWSILYSKYVSTESIKCTSVRRSAIHHYNEYHCCAIKHLKACKAILVAYDACKGNQEDEKLLSDQLIFEEIYYLSGYILECAAKSLLLKACNWKGYKLHIFFDSPLFKELRDKYKICWSWKQSQKGFLVLEDHFSVNLLKWISHNPYFSCEFTKIPLFNGCFHRFEHGIAKTEFERLLRKEKIIFLIDNWNTALRYREIPNSQQRITEKQAVLLIALCDQIVKAIGPKPSCITLDSNTSVADSFRRLVARYTSEQQNNNAI